MSIADTGSSFSSEEKNLFRPFTRESLRAIEQRIAEDHAKQKELEEKRAEGEVSFLLNRGQVSQSPYHVLVVKFWLYPTPLHSIFSPEHNNLWRNAFRHPK